jgi:hypothetical protein
VCFQMPDIWRPPGVIKNALIDLFTDVRWDVRLNRCVGHFQFNFYPESRGGPRRSFSIWKIMPVI